MTRFVRALLGVCLCSVSTGLGADDAFYPELDPSHADAVRAVFRTLKADERGPYSRLRWFCADGSVHPPAGAPCRERGGGVQHAELKDEARRIAEHGFHVGTILQAIDFETFFDAAHDHYLLRELVVQQYLFEVDDGWVLRRARYYRGARQIEDEEKKGREFLQRALSRPEWNARNFLLASELVATVPHGSGVEARGERVRNLATEIANLDPAFQELRVKIHSFPSRDDLRAVQTFAAAKRHDDAVREKLSELQDALKRRYDPSQWSEELKRFLPRVEPSLRARLEALMQSAAIRSPRETIATIASIGLDIRRQATSGERANGLVLIELSRMLLQRAFALLSESSRDEGPLSRRDRLHRLRDVADLATVAGFLSFRERAAFHEELDTILASRSLTALAYADALRYLGRSLDWGVGTVRGTFGVVLDRYSVVEPKSAGLTDALIRGSPLLFLGSELERLSDDVAAILEQSHEIFGARVGPGVRGLNPGVAVRPFDIIDPGAFEARLDGSRIYVVPETLAELTPPAGVLTLDAGNPLSHVQLLARNAAIPNASISSSFLPELRKFSGSDVFYAVSPRGTVVLKLASEMTATEMTLVEESREAKAARIELDTSRLDLSRARPLFLTELRDADIGAVVGPKAGKVAELSRFFPGMVSRGLALPFGMFAAHVRRPFEGVDVTAQERMVRAYVTAERMREEEGVSEAEIDEMMFAELAHFRRAILELEWLPGMKAEIVAALGTAFRDGLSDGVFVRSDTNVEDLPQFSGAGLNLTLPHRRTSDEILSSIKRVWTSPFMERAYLWRKQILVHQGEVYPSVLLLESVPSEKSGVLITSGLQYGSESDLTVAVAQGVGGAVDGEEAETILVRADASVKLLSQAKAVRQKELVNEGLGGIRIVPTTRPDRLMHDADIAQIRDVVSRWKRQAGSDSARIWDFEFGFVDGKLWLFQVRPFVRFRNTELLNKLAILDAAALRNGGLAVSLEEKR